MLEHTHAILKRAEAALASGADIKACLGVLRELGIDDFGELLCSMPDRAWPRLSAILPRMASMDVQSQWVGSSGLALHRLTMSTVRQFAYLFLQHAGRPLDNAMILDFGCGFGRLIRPMYYFTDPDRIYGIDPWDRSLDLCRADRVMAELRQSERVPKDLPVDGRQFDLAYAFSVFTHLSEPAAIASLAALRKVVKQDGLLMLTIRPIEFWDHLAEARKLPALMEMKAVHRAMGFAYYPQTGGIGDTFGDTTIEPAWLGKVSGWTFLASDRTLINPLQITMVARPA